MDARKVEPYVAGALALAGLLAILLAVGSESWPVLLGWTGAIVVVALAGRALRERHGAKLAGAAVLAVACVLLTWEGGLFFVPAALALVAFELVLAVRARRARLRTG